MDTVTQALLQADARKVEVELVRASGGRVTGWGWSCTCGATLPPSVIKRSRALTLARLHYVGHQQS